MAERRLVLYQPNGAKVPGKWIDLRGVPNADARASLTLQVEQKCSLGHWHAIASPVVLPNYDHDDDDLAALKETWRPACSSPQTTEINADKDKRGR